MIKKNTFPAYFKPFLLANNEFTSSWLLVIIFVRSMYLIDFIAFSVSSNELNASKAS